MISISKPFIGEEEKKGVLETLESGMLAQGSRTAQFEERFAELCGVNHAIATSNGTSALYIALLANGVGPGDEVITTPFTFIATINAILLAGAQPVFVDIDDKTFNIDPIKIEEAVTPNCKALLPVHLYGQMCDMDRIRAIAEKHQLAIIEDACQAVMASFKGKRSGSFGTGTFSFYATKNMMTGEGGMITTDDDQIAKQSRMIRNHGMQKRYYHEMFGFNFRMMDLQAAIGLAQLDRLEAFTARRKTNAAYLNGEIKSVMTPITRKECDHVWHQYTIRVENGKSRDAAVDALRHAGIGTGIYYPVPAHQQASIKEVVGEQELPVAEQMADEVLSLPVHPQLTEEDLEHIAREVNKL